MQKSIAGGSNGSHNGNASVEEIPKEIDQLELFKNHLTKMSGNISGERDRQKVQPDLWFKAQTWGTVQNFARGGFYRTPRGLVALKDVNTIPYVLDSKEGQERERVALTFLKAASLIEKNPNYVVVQDASSYKAKLADIGKVLISRNTPMNTLQVLLRALNLDPAKIPATDDEVMKILDSVLKDYYTGTGPAAAMASPQNKINLRAAINKLEAFKNSQGQVDLSKPGAKEAMAQYNKYIVAMEADLMTSIEQALVMHIGKDIKPADPKQFQEAVQKVHGGTLSEEAPIPHTLSSLSSSKTDAIGQEIYFEALESCFAEAFDSMFESGLVDNASAEEIDQLLSGVKDENGNSVVSGIRDECLEKLKMYEPTEITQLVEENGQLVPKTEPFTRAAAIGRLATAEGDRVFHWVMTKLRGRLLSGKDYGPGHRAFLRFYEKTYAQDPVDQNGNPIPLPASAKPETQEYKNHFREKGQRLARKYGMIWDDEDCKKIVPSPPSSFFNAEETIKYNKCPQLKLTKANLFWPDNKLWEDPEALATMFEMMGPDDFKNFALINLIRAKYEKKLDVKDFPLLKLVGSGQEADDKNDYMLAEMTKHLVAGTTQLEYGAGSNRAAVALAQTIAALRGEFAELEKNEYRRNGRLYPDFTLTQKVNVPNGHAPDGTPLFKVEEKRVPYPPILIQDSVFAVAGNGLVRQWDELTYHQKARRTIETIVSAADEVHKSGLEATSKWNLFKEGFQGFLGLDLKALTENRELKRHEWQQHEHFQKQMPQYFNTLREAGAELHKMGINDTVASWADAPPVAGTYSKVLSAMTKQAQAGVDVSIKNWETGVTKAVADTAWTAGTVVSAPLFGAVGVATSRVGLFGLRAAGNVGVKLFTGSGSLTSRVAQGIRVMAPEFKGAYHGAKGLWQGNVLSSLTHATRSSGAISNALRDGKGLGFMALGFTKFSMGVAQLATAGIERWNGHRHEPWSNRGLGTALIVDNLFAGNDALSMGKTVGFMSMFGGAAHATRMALMRYGKWVQGGGGTSFTWTKSSKPVVESLRIKNLVDKKTATVWANGLTSLGSAGFMTTPQIIKTGKEQDKILEKIQVLQQQKQAEEKKPHGNKKTVAQLADQISELEFEHRQMGVQKWTDAVSEVVFFWAFLRFSTEMWGNETPPRDAYVRDVRREVASNILSQKPASGSSPYTYVMNKNQVDSLKKLSDDIHAQHEKVGLEVSEIQARPFSPVQKYQGFSVKDLGNGKFEVTIDQPHWLLKRDAAQKAINLNAVPAGRF